MVKITSKIEERIKESGLRDDYIAEQLGVSKKTVYNWKKGLSYPTFETGFVLSILLGCKMDDLIGVENEE